MAVTSPAETLDDLVEQFLDAWADGADSLMGWPQAKGVAMVGQSAWDAAVEDRWAARETLAILENSTDI